MTDFPTVGDPEAMRALARRLQAIAADLRPGPASAQAALDQSEFEGPAAGRVRTAAGEASLQAQRAAGDIESLAASLVTDAASVEEQNDELRRIAQQPAPASDAAPAADAQTTAESAQLDPAEPAT